MPVSGATVTGLPEFRRELRGLGDEWPKELRKIHKTIADAVALRARGVASAMGGVQAKAAGAIRGTATQSQARISVSPGIGSVAFWGAKKHTGWYAAHRYAKSARQHPVWVGNSWDVGDAGGGPYAINPAIAAYIPTLLREYGDLIDDLMHRAFPER